MDTLEKWHAHIVDVQTLFRHWEANRAAGRANQKRAREILTICLFTLCLENNENKRFLIGFQQRGKPPAEGGPVWDLFKDGFGEIENVDVILIPDLGPNGPAEREIHRCQLVGYRDRPNPSTEDLIEFLEEKKLPVFVARQRPSLNHSSRAGNSMGLGSAFGPFAKAPASAVQSNIYGCSNKSRSTPAKLGVPSDLSSNALAQKPRFGNRKNGLG